MMDGNQTDGGSDGGMSGSMFSSLLLMQLFMSLSSWKREITPAILPLSCPHDKVSNQHSFYTNFLSCRIVITVQTKLVCETSPSSRNIIEQSAKSSQLLSSWFQTDAMESCKEPSQALGHYKHKDSRLERICFKQVGCPPSIVWFSYTLLHNFSEVGVFHGSCYPLLIIDLFVNCRHEQKVLTQLMSNSKIKRKAPINLSKKGYICCKSSICSVRGYCCFCFLILTKMLETILIPEKDKNKYKEQFFQVMISFMGRTMEHPINVRMKLNVLPVNMWVHSE